MNYKWILCAVLPVFLVSCGGGTKSDGVSGREPGVLILVNGKENVDSITATEYEATRDNTSSSLELCISGGVELYDNYADITDPAHDEYCDGSQFVTNPYITFQISYINSTYDPITLTYTGVGVTIKIYNSSNEEVWNSDTSLYLGNKLNGYDDYDPTARHEIVLGAQQAFPNQVGGLINARKFSFTADSNFTNSIANDPKGDFNPLAYGEQQLNLLYYTDGYCQLDLADVNSNGYLDKPICQNIHLGPDTYTAEITTNFNDQMETHTVKIVVNPAT